MPAAAYTFLPFVRRGLAGLIPHGLGSDRVALPLRLRVNRGPQIGLDVRLHGPGDVIGIDPRTVIRTEPPPLATGVETNLFAAVDFDPPDFPWMFTPSGLDPGIVPEARRLRPWLCLVVVSSEHSTLAFDPVRPLPVLRCLRSELPDLEESWAWAHAQVMGSADASGLATSLAGSPELTASRLLCPRRLRPETVYRACVVPALRCGVEAGLGEPVTSDGTRPAWPTGDEGPAEVVLPVYYHWSFTTGTPADFESLVRLLQGVHLPADVGLEPMDVSAPGLGLPPAGDRLGLAGALRGSETRDAPWPDAQRRPFQDAVRTMLNAAEASLASPPAAAGPEPRPDPVVAPPLYGRWHAAHPFVDESAPPWLPELNLDPRHRVAAGLGVRVVQHQQEQLLAAAWEQLGEIARANELLRQAQLSRAVGQLMLEKRLARLPSGALLQTTGPAHARVLLDAGTLKARVRRSALPEAAVSGAFRRLTRPRGPLGRRLMPPGQRRVRPLVQRLAVGELRPGAEPEPPRGMVTMESVSEAVGAARPHSTRFQFTDASSEALRAAMARATAATGAAPPAPRTPRRAARPVPTRAELSRIGTAAVAHQAHLMGAFAVDPPPARPDLPLDEVRRDVLRALDPARTVLDRMRLRVRPSTPGVWARPDPLEPLLVHPVFPYPMLGPLAELAPDRVLPGLDRVPANVATLVEADPRFIESYMAGLNHEMSGELLWREFPTDQRGTAFRRFWDTAGAPGGDEAADIPPLNAWARPLGGNMTGVTASALLVLLIRGELLRRYPGTLIYAVPAEWAGAGRRPAAPEVYPLFRGGLEPDLTFAGFPLTPEQVRGADAPPGAAGWYFVLQQQPAEPRFGLDLDAGSSAPASWDELAWAHVATTSSGHVSIAATPTATTAVMDPGGARWGVNAAHVAAVTLQRPVRVAIHARTMLDGGGI